MSSEESETRSERVLIYDEECRMCVTAKEGIERMEGEGAGEQPVRWVPYGSDEAACRLGRHYQPGRPDVAYLVEADGTIRPGLDAFLALLPGLRGGRVLSMLMKLPFLRPMGYVVYRILARNRYRWYGSVSRSGPGASGSS